MRLLIFTSNFIFSQSGFQDWDKNYNYRSYEEIIQSELDYAQEVEKDTTQGHYYVALGKYRFIAEFTGNHREIDPESNKSMRRVLK